jgi:hypothetical protein
MKKKNDSWVGERLSTVTVKRKTPLKDGGRTSADWYGNELVTIEPGGRKLSRAEIMQRVERLLEGVE